MPSGEQLSIYDAAMRYQSAGTPLVVLAGKEYGTGSSRDWAARGAMLLGVKAVIAESFERIHRSNLIGMGVLPCQFAAGQNAQTLGLTGREVFDFGNLRNAEVRTVTVTAHREGGVEPVVFEVRVRIDTPKERDYYRHGGILHYVLRQLARTATPARSKARPKRKTKAKAKTEAKAKTKTQPARKSVRRASSRRATARRGK
jgi:aconitate hydratase